MGSAASAVSNKISDVKSKRANTGPNASTPEKENNDEDLAKEIMTYLNGLSKDYNRDGKFTQFGGQSSNVTPSTKDAFFFLGQPFTRDRTLYRVDMMKHIDFRTTGDPEYTVMISKVDNVHKDRTFGGLGTGMRLSGRKGPSTRTGPSFNKAEVLKCSQPLAKQIWLKADEINRNRQKSNTGDARGGNKIGD
jgi:hypothetical protein